MLAVVLTCALFASILGLEANNSLILRDDGHVSTNRTAKFLGWWWTIGIGVVRFENSVCPAANGLLGICYTRRQCTVVNGYASGKCARNIGVCCVVQATCGNTSSHNNTYFTNPGFPNTYAGGTACTLTIQRCNPDICQHIKSWVLTSTKLRCSGRYGVHSEIRCNF